MSFSIHWGDRGDSMLEHDRRGWTATVGGVVAAQYVGLGRAVWAMLQEARRSRAFRRRWINEDPT